MLDGNVAAGPLSEVFALELTTAHARCGSCGAEGPLAEMHAFVDAPGLVLRCAFCDAVMLVLVHSRDRYVLAMSGMERLMMRA